MRQLSQTDVQKMSRRASKRKPSKKDIVGIEYMSGANPFEITDKGLALVKRANDCWDAMSSFRKQSRRSSRYYKGEQWKDMVCDNGRWITEEEYITRQGKPALKQNLIRPNVRNIVGQLRSAPYKSIVYSRNEDGQLAADMVSVALESVHTMNGRQERDARMFESFLVKGCGIYWTGYPYNDELKMPLVTYRAIDLSRYFRTMTATDVNGEDVDFCGDFFDSSPEEITSMYAHSRSQEEALRKIYGPRLHSQMAATNPLTTSDEQLAGPSVNPSDGKCRVIRVCQKEGHWELRVHDFSDGSWEAYELTTAKKREIEAEIASRKKIAADLGVDYEDPANRLLIKYDEKYIMCWEYYHVTPWGHILMHQRAPYDHNSHCYVEKFYPLFDGQSYGMVYDLIDQQRMINRMIILQDFITSAAAKGVLLVPEEAIPDDMDIEDFADEWSKYNGVIKVKTKDGIKLPEQIVSRQINVGQFDMINLQLKLMNDIGGIHDALQGKSLGTGTPASLYQQETANAQLNVLDYLESFSWLLMQRDYKCIQLICQFYTDKEYIQIGGSTFSEAAKHYDPSLVRKFKYFNEVVKSHDTPLARMYFDDQLFRMMQANLITLEQYLEESSTPFAKSLLKKIQSQKQQMEATGQMPTQEQLATLQADIPESKPFQMEAMMNMYNRR